MPRRGTGRAPLRAAEPGPAYENHPHFFVVNSYEGRTDGRLGRVHHVPDYGIGGPVRRVLAAAGLLLCSVRIFLAERPNVLVTTGPATGLVLAVLVRATGGHVVYVECSAQVTVPSRSGRAFRWLAHRFYVQWPTLLEHYPNAEYRGLLL